MTAPTLFGAAYSVYTRTARLTLAEKGVDYRFDERHPFGKIPAFEHDGLRLYETAAICRYVDEAFDGPALQPATPAGRAVMAQAIGICDSYLYRAGVWDIYVERLRVPARGGTSDEAKIATAIPTVRKVLSELARLSAVHRRPGAEPRRPARLPDADPASTGAGRARPRDRGAGDRVVASAHGRPRQQRENALRR
jgi:glutathione S-transferase